MAKLLFILFAWVVCGIAPPAFGTLPCTQISKTAGARALRIRATS